MLPPFYHYRSTHIDFSAEAHAESDWDITVRSTLCTRCGRTVWSARYRPVRASVVYPQKRWPDVLHCYIVAPVVSDRVVADLREAGIGGFDVHPVELTDVPAKKTCPWRYWLIEPKARVIFDPVLETDAQRALVCSDCGVWVEMDFVKAGVPLPQRRLRESTWHGADFVWALWGDRYWSLCSGRVIDLAGQKGWTNFRFIPFGHGERNANYRDPNWRTLLEEGLRQLESRTAATPTPAGGTAPATAAPVPVSGQVVAPATPAHPFDNLTDDGYAFQGDVELKAGFGMCGLLVFPDGDDGPSGEQRDLFDDFIASEAEWLPALKRKIEAALAKAAAKGTVTLSEAMPESVGQFSNLARWLASPDVSIDEQSGENEGVVELAYGIRGTDYVLCVKLGPRSEAGKWQIRVGIGVVGETVSDARQREASGEV